MNVEVTERLVKLEDDGLFNQNSRTKRQKYQRYANSFSYYTCGLPPLIEGWKQYANSILVDTGLRKPPMFKLLYDIV